ncbi:exo-beta-N-acetylmuramidase NamZ domain-containing protein [Acidobacteriota bacterium]
MTNRKFCWKTVLIVSLVFFFTCNPQDTQEPFKIGLENLLENHLDLIQGKKIGIIANQTSLDAEGRNIVNLLSRHAEITTLFGPEHGFYGNIEDGAAIDDSVHTKIKLYSLYGEYLTPTPDMLKDVDVLIYDIQDVGVKFYTFVSNLFLAMTAAEQQDIPIIVLDRPNPITAKRVEGAITLPAYASFVGVMPLPMRYGMTVGELSNLFNGETYGGFSINADLTVLEMTGYTRDMWYDEIGFPWTATSPNMTTLDTAIIYPGTCLMEGTNLSEGRGTDTPFLTIGAPYLDAQEWLDEISEEALIGVEIDVVTFNPKAISGVTSNPKYKDEECYGFHFKITDRESLDPIELAVASLCAAQKLYPQHFKMTKYIDKLWGNENLRAMVSEGKDYHSILQTCESGIERFRKVREKYLLYQ